MAPSCVYPKLIGTGMFNQLWVSNRCTGAVRIKVVIAHRSDTPCTRLDAGEAHLFEWGWPGRYERVVRC